jgi:hypothetical protein
MKLVVKKLEIDRGGVIAFLIDQAGGEGNDFFQAYTIDKIYLHVKRK